jgi:hypothetical protein
MIRLMRKMPGSSLILTTFKSSGIFGGSWGSSVNWLELKMEPRSGNLACPNLRNAL